MAKTTVAAPATGKSPTTTDAEGKKIYLMEESAWDASSSPEFGGQSDILELEVGQIAGPLTYIGYSDMKLESGDVRVHQAQTEGGETIRCPIATAFLRSFDQASIEKGDKFAIKRYDDTVKKAGKGKGQNMHIYAVKVLVKAPVGA